MKAIPQGEPVELLIALIRNACVNDGTPDSGHEHRSVATLAEYFGAPGEVVEPHPGRQSVVYRVPGTEPKAPALLLVPHLDVVPVNVAGWSVDPFGGERRNGFVWGRGAVDMLNVTAAMAAVFKRYLDGEESPLPGDLVFAGVADEEAGSVLGVEWLMRERPELLAADYALTEVANPSINGVLPVTVAEKGPAWRRLRTTGTPGHGSQPYGADNALIPLAQAIARLGDTPTPVDITPEWRTFVEGLGLDAELAARLTDPDLVDGAIDDLAVDDVAFARWVHACTHMTLTPSLLSSGVKANVVPDSGVAEVDVRKLPGQEEADVDDHFRKVLGPDLSERIDIEPVMTFPANSSPASGLLWESIGDALEAMTGSRSMVPAVIPVTTDARFLRKRGVVVYGVGLYDDEVSFGDMLSMFHGNDERVSERSVGLTTELLARTVARFGERSA